MSALQHWGVRVLGLGLAASSVLGGCVQRTPAAARPGELELRVESRAAYGVAGRFHLLGVEPDAPAVDIDFEPGTASQYVALPPGQYMLTLEAGARIHCHDDDASGSSVAPSSRLVSAWPQRIRITPGGRVTARIAFGAAPVALGTRAAALAVDDPCTGSPYPSGEQALLAR